MSEPTEFKGQPVLFFETPAAWRAWLDAHHATHPGFWLRLYPKASGRPTLTYAQALDEALCYGWIDSQKNKDAPDSYLQRFGPRKPKGIWSQVNRGHVERLVAAGLMMPAGQAQVDAAQADGRWDAAYAPASTISVPDDLQAALDVSPAAQARWGQLTKTNSYAFLFRIHQAKRPETRAKRIATTIAMLEQGEQYH